MKNDAFFHGMVFCDEIDLKNDRFWRKISA